MPTQSEPLTQQNSPQHFATHLNLNHLTWQHFSSSDQRSHCKKTRQATFKVDKHKQSDFQTLLGIPCETQREPSPTSKGENKKIPARGLGLTARSHTKQVHPVGTIMSEKFDDNRCGCETKECFPKKCLCKIKCSDGDADDFTEKVTDHQKAKELHSRLQQPSVNDCKQAMMMTST